MLAPEINHAASDIANYSALVYRATPEEQELHWCVPSSLFRVPLETGMVHALMADEGLPQGSFGKRVADEIQQMWKAVSENEQFSSVFSSASYINLPPYFEQLWEKEAFVSLLSAADRDTTPALWELGLALAQTSQAMDRGVTRNRLEGRYRSEFPSVHEFMQAAVTPETRTFADQMITKTPELKTLGYPFLGDIEPRLHPCLCDPDTAVRQGFTVPHLFSQSVRSLASFPPMVAFRAGLDGNFGLSPLAPVYQKREEDLSQANRIKHAEEPVSAILASIGDVTDQPFAHPEREIDAATVMIFQNILHSPVAGRQEAIAHLTNLSEDEWREIVRDARQSLFCPTYYYDPKYSGSGSFFLNHALPFFCASTYRSVIQDERRKSPFGAEKLLGDFPLSQLERIAFDWLPEAITRLPERSRTELWQKYREILENNSFGSCIRFWANDEREKVKTVKRMTYAEESLSIWHTIMNLHPSYAYEFIKLWSQVEWIYNASYLAFKLRERNISLAIAASNGLQFSVENIHDQVLLLDDVQRKKEDSRPVSLTLSPHEYMVFTGGNGLGKTVTTRTVGQAAIDVGTQNPIFGVRAIIPPDTISFVLADESEHVRDDEGLSVFGKELLFFLPAQNRIRINRFF